MNASIGSVECPTVNTAPSGHSGMSVLACDVAARPVARELAQHCAGYQTGAAGIVVIEQPADQLAGCEQAGDGAAVGALDLAVGRDLQAAEGEGEPAGHGVGL